MSEENNRVVELLVEKIETMKDKVSWREESINQARVISARVMPLLSALGWDPEDTNEVVVRVRGNSLYMDIRGGIALGGNMEDPDGEVHVVVGVKDPEDSLRDGKYISQLEDYCLKQQSGLGVLTNGIEWDFYLYSKDTLSLSVGVNIKDQDVNDCASKLVQFLGRENISQKQHLQFANKAVFIKEVEQAWQNLLKDRDEMRCLAQRHLSEKRGKQVVEEEEQWLEEWLEGKIPELHSVASEGKPEESSTSGKSESEPKEIIKRFLPMYGGVSQITRIVVFGKQISVYDFREALMTFLQELESKYPGSLEQLTQEDSPVCFKDPNQIRKSTGPRQIGDLLYWTKVNADATTHRRTCRKALEALGKSPDDVQFFWDDWEYKDYPGRRVALVREE